MSVQIAHTLPSFNHVISVLECVELHHVVSGNTYHVILHHSN